MFAVAPSSYGSTRLTLESRNSPGTPKACLALTTVWNPVVFMDSPYFSGLRYLVMKSLDSAASSATVGTAFLRRAAM